MDKITFDFENGTVIVENDSQNMTMTDENLKSKKERILKSADMISVDSDDLEREFISMLLEEKLNSILSKKSESKEKEQNKEKTTKKVAVKKVGNELEYIEVDATYRCELEDIIVTKPTDVDILENVYLNNDNTLVMIVDEDGHSKGYDVNIMLETTHKVNHVVEIRGNIVFARIKKLNIFEENYDYEIENLLSSDIPIINKIVERGKYLKYVLGK